MKWIFLLVLLISVAPLAWWIRRNPTKRTIIWIVFGFLAVQHGPFHLYMAAISWATWPGFVKGMEISLLDGLALAISLTLPPPRRPFPLRVLFSLYMLAVLFAVLQAPNIEPALFCAWQTAKVFFIALVVSRAAAYDSRIVLSLLQGMGYGILVALGIASWDRAVGGVLQATGGFQHQNQLGMMTLFVAFPFLSLLLARGSDCLTKAVPIAGAVIAILTVSRSAIAFVLGGYVLLFMLSCLRGWSARKGNAAAAALLAAALLVPWAATDLNVRLGDQPIIAEDEEREAFQRAAAMMLDDYPLGVGPNHYVVVASTQGYSDRAGVAPTQGSRSANVHNAYWLMAAETGYFGVTTYVLLLAQPLLMAFHGAWRQCGDWRGDILLGLGIALLAVYLQSLVEWALVSFQVQYMFGVAAGLIVGLTRHRQVAQPFSFRPPRIRPAAFVDPPLPES